jgi:hypothetical protein
MVDKLGDGPVVPVIEEQEKAQHAQPHDVGSLAPREEGADVRTLQHDVEWQIEKEERGLPLPISFHHQGQEREGNQHFGGEEQGDDQPLML